MTATDAIMEGIRDALRTNPENRPAWLAYADALQDAGDPRGELYALMFSPRQSPDEERRYRHLRGTVPLLAGPEMRQAVLLLSAFSSLTPARSPGEAERQLGRLAAHLRERCHPLAAEVDRFCGGDTIVLYNDGRFVVSRGGGAHDQGAYPDPIEAAIAGIAAAPDAPARWPLTFQCSGAFRAPGGPWPSWWASLVTRGR